MRTRHQKYYDLFKEYKDSINRADVMRYFILYDFGGVYLDLDVEVLKPLDIWTYLSPSILSHENYEHSYILHKRSAPNVINAVMASQPRHPFYKLLQDNLQGFNQKYLSSVLQATGPFFVDDVYHIYANNNSASNPNNQITIIDPMYWFPVYDPALSCSQLMNECESIFRRYSEDVTSHLASIHRIRFSICKGLHDKYYSNKAGRDSYLVHHWVHTYFQSSEFKTQNVSSVYTVAPDLIPVAKRLNLQCTNNTR